MAFQASAFCKKIDEYRISNFLSKLNLKMVFVKEHDIT